MVHFGSQSDTYILPKDDSLDHGEKIFRNVTTFALGLKAVVSRPAFASFPIYLLPRGAVFICLARHEVVLCLRSDMGNYVCRKIRASILKSIMMLH